MPAPIIEGFINYIAAQLNVSVWDGEVPRYDTSGNKISPTSTTTPTDWPVVKLFMQPGGFSREWTTEDPYTDRGELLIQIWATSRVQLEDPTTGMLNRMEQLLASATNWTQINLGGPNTNPYYVIACLLTNWYSGQEEGVRTQQGELLYRADMHYDVMIHGSVSTA